jgi:hypothetical protein
MLGSELVKRDNVKYSPINRFIRHIEDGWDSGCGGVSVSPIERKADRSIEGDIAEYPDEKVIPEQDYAVFAGRVPMYALDRGLRLETCKAWELGHDQWRKRLLFPARDYRGRLVGVSGRLYTPGCPRCHRLPGAKKYRSCPSCGYSLGEKYLHTDGFKKEYVLYGEHMINRDLDYGIVVEGPLDVLKLWQHGFENVVGVFGSEPSVKQMRKLVHFFKRVVVFIDADKAGKKMGEKLAQRLVPFLEDYHVVGGYKNDGKDPADRSCFEVMGMLSQVGIGPTRSLVRDSP